MELDPGLVDILGCRCGSVACPTCSWSRGGRAASLFLSDCARLGVTAVSMWTTTMDGSRFGDRFHVQNQRVSSRLMEKMWGYLSVKFRRRFPEPVWWAFAEPQDGKRAKGKAGTWNMHDHILFPSPNRTGRLTRECLESVRSAGVEWSGRTSYGWSDKCLSVAVRNARGYMAKGVAYAAKGIEYVPREVLESRSFHPMRRSRAVTVDDPLCVEQRQRGADDRVKRRRLEGFAESAGRCGRWGEAVRCREVLESYAVQSPRGRQRTQAERVSGCRTSTTVQVGGVYSTFPIPHSRFQSAAADLVPLWFSEDDPDQAAQGLAVLGGDLRGLPYGFGSRVVSVAGVSLSGAASDGVGVLSPVPPAYPLRDVLERERGEANTVSGGHVVDVPPCRGSTVPGMPRAECRGGGSGGRRFGTGRALQGGPGLHISLSAGLYGDGWSGERAFFVSGRRSGFSGLSCGVARWFEGAGTPVRPRPALPARPWRRNLVYQGCFVNHREIACRAPP
jgi:hypothetical protein